MALNYAALRNAKLTPLSEAVSKWRNLPGKFDTIARLFGSTVTKGLQDSDWTGETAEAAFAKFDQVEREMQAASDEAQDIYSLLNSAFENFQSAQNNLKSVEKYVTEDENLKINEEGKVYCDPPPAKIDQSAALQKAYLDTVRSCNEKIQSALTDAENADTVLHWALMRDVNGRRRGFNPDVSTSIKGASKDRRQAAEDAREFVKLAGLGDKLTDAQLAKMNKGFAKYEGDPYFNEKFATGLGPENALKFWSAVADPNKGGYSRVPYEHSKERLKQLASLQDNLGRSLGSATRSDSAAMRSWEKEMINLGSSRIDTADAGGPYGFQVMSNLMREGEYDAKFLKDYGKALIEDDKRFSEEPFDPYQHWTLNSESDLNFGAKDDRGQDPITGFMQALGHNPNASTDFFSFNENFDYLTADRSWPSDSTGSGDSGGAAGFTVSLSRSRISDHRSFL